MDDNEFYLDRQTVNPTRRRFLGSSGMTLYVEDKARSIYKDVVLEMFGDIEDLDDASRRIAIQHVTDRLNNRLGRANARNRTSITVEQVARVVERMRLRDHTIKDAPVELTREAYELVEEEHTVSGDSRKAIASRLVLAGYAAMAQGFFGETGDFLRH